MYAQVLFVPVSCSFPPLLSSVAIALTTINHNDPCGVFEAWPGLPYIPCTLPKPCLTMFMDLVVQKNIAFLFDWLSNCPILADYLSVYLSTPTNISSSCFPQLPTKW